MTPCPVPSRCLRKYSWPFPDEPSRLERHTKRLRGQLTGLSGSSQAMRSPPDRSCSATYSPASHPASSAARATSRGFAVNWGADGSQPIRSARTL